MTAYYNEFDPFAAQWLRNLITEGLIAPGDVDDRSIKEVKPDDLRGYAQCHFFAGIGGWSYALRLAGWPDDRPVWTGSCPCQPFSVAGKQAGFDDPRHLWPTWRELIRECNPPVVFGEQVAGASQWLNLVRGDLEEMGRAVGCIPLEAASADAEHFRDRYWIVADGEVVGRQDRYAGSVEGTEVSEWAPLQSERRGSEDTHGPLADGDGTAGQQDPGSTPCDEEAHGRAGWDPCQSNGDHRFAGDGETYQRRPLVNDPSIGWGEGWTESEFRSRGFTAAVASIDGKQYLECPDGKWRRLPPPRVRWLGNGIPARVAKLRAIGNAIDPRPAAQFIRAYLETTA